MKNYWLVIFGFGFRRIDGCFGKYFVKGLSIVMFNRQVICILKFKGVWKNKKGRSFFFSRTEKSLVFRSIVLTLKKYRLH